MYKFVIMTLHDMEISDKRIIVSLERNMKCGVGKCGHCQINHLYVCQDGPVFYYDDIKLLKEAI
jgi:sulfhydrogenase subunit gamma (sulfur reductase)